MGKPARTLNFMTRQVEKQRHLLAMPLADRCELIGAFTDALVDEAREVQSHGNDHAKDIDEKIFARETHALRRLVSTLSYSETFYAWARCSTNMVAETMQSERRAGDLRETWKRANPTQRHEIIVDFLQTQAETFGIGLGFEIPQPELIYMTHGRPSTIGCVGSDFEEIRKGIFPAVELRKHLFHHENPAPAFETAYHEGMHYAITALAIRFLGHGMDIEDPFYNDALLQAEKFRYNAIVPSEVHSAYRAQPEEEICYGEEDRLNKLWFELRPGS